MGLYPGSNSVPQVIGLFVALYAGFWMAGEMGTPPLITALVVLGLYVKVADVTVYNDYA